MWMLTPKPGNGNERDCKPRTRGGLTPKVALPRPLTSRLTEFLTVLPLRKCRSSLVPCWLVSHYVDCLSHLHSIYCYISHKPSEGNTLTFNNTPWVSVEIHRCQLLLSIYPEKLGQDGGQALNPVSSAAEEKEKPRTHERILKLCIC